MGDVYDLHPRVILAGHRRVRPVAYVVDGYAASPAQLGKAAGTCGDRGRRDRGGGLGDVDYKHVILKATDGHRVRPARHLSYGHTPGPVRFSEPTGTCGDGCDLDGKFGVGDVRYLHAVVYTADGHPVCPARHLGDGHLAGPIHLN